MSDLNRLPKIRAWLSEHIANLQALSPDDITFDTPIDNFGLDSVDSVVLTGELGEWLGIELPSTLLYDADNLEEVCQLAARQAGPEQSEAVHAKVPVRQIAIAATFTAEPIAESLTHVLKTVGLPVETVFAPYNQVFQSLLDPASQLSVNKGGINILLLRLEDWFRFENGPVSLEAAYRTVEDLRIALKAAAERSGIPLILAFCPHTPDKLDALGLAGQMPTLDEALMAAAKALPGVTVLDVRQLQADYRLETALDPARDVLGHIPFTPELFTALGLTLARTLFRALHVPYKVIVLDCDNTLWAGVVGEDSPYGVCVEAPHRELQRLMRVQQENGRLLCLASKNNEADVWSVFDCHPEMPLQRAHLVGWRINWRRKSENLKELAAELGLGLDSFIFIDDNPAECAEVAAALPEVTVITLPANPERLTTLLTQHWALDLGAATEEDHLRTTMMQQNRERRVLEQSASSFEQFLQALCIVVEFAPMQPSEVARCAQLSERTNQFNTTTLRRSEAEVALLLTEPPTAFTVRVRDRFGDYGLVGFAVTALHGDVFAVESFMMSCRVLGKRVEHEVVRHLAEVAAASKARTLRFAFQPTERNRPALEFLDSLATGLQKDESGVGVVEFAPSEVEALLTAATTTHVPAEEPAPTIFVEPVACVSSSELQRLAELNGDALGILAEIRAQVGRRPDLDTPFITPRTPLQRQIAEIWADILRFDRIGIYDSFFDLGGDSLGSAELLARLYRLGLSETISLGTLGNPTVAGLAQAVEDIRQGRPPNMVAALTSLDDEALLADDIRVRETLSASANPRTYFITGASGYVGAYLLDELLRTTDAHFICHVRARSQEDGLARIIGNLHSYGLWREQDHARLTVVLGDLAAPLLGLTPEIYEWLAEQADAIIHNGAWVNFIFPYQHLKSANVGGTESVLRFALHRKLKPLHFISTLGVLMSGGYGRDRKILEDEDLNHSEDLPNGYEQTKWVADKLVRRAMDIGLPASIYRLGMLSGLSDCGTYHKTSEFLPCFLKGCVQLGSFPQLDSKIEMVPVDFVTRSVARIIIAAPDSLGRTYHINHPNAVTDADFATWIRNYGYPMRHVPWDVWKRELISAGPRLRENALYPFLDFIRGLQAHQTYIPEMGMTNFFAAVGNEVALCPDQFTLLQRYFDHFVSTSYLSAPNP